MRELLPCSACQVPFTSKTGLNNHLSGKYVSALDVMYLQILMRWHLAPGKRKKVY